MQTLDFQKLSVEIHQNAKAKGFWDSQRNVGELFMLIVSELGEALEAHRKGRFANIKEFNERISKSKIINNHAYAGTVAPDRTYAANFRSCIKDTFEDEIADTVIRILDYVGWRGDLKIDLYYYKSSVDMHLFSKNIGEILIEITFEVCNASQYARMHTLGLTKRYVTSLEEKINAALIMLVKLSEQCGFDLSRHIEAKMKYNSTRERLHGKSY